MIYEIPKIQALFRLTYLGFQNHSSVFIIFLPVSIQGMTDSCFHTDKEEASSFLLSSNTQSLSWDVE